MNKIVLESQENLVSKNWYPVTLDQISEIIMGQAPPSISYNKNRKGILFVKVGEFGKLFPKKKVWTTDPLRIAGKNDVLVCVVGSIGKINLGIECAIGRSVAAIKPNLLILNQKFLYYFLTGHIRKLKESQQGTTHGVISQNKLNQFKILLPPLNEQKRIVSKIEELFSLIESDLHELQKIKNQIIHYKKSLLFSAFNGNMTEKWRNENPDFLGKDTVEDSLKQRQRLWGKKEKSKKNPRKYSHPVKPSLSGLPKIPNSWTWASFEEISERVTVGHVGSMRNEYLDYGIPFLRSQNVRENRFDEKGLKFISKEFHEKLSKSKLSPNDIVAVRSGDVGTSCVIPETLKDANCSDLLIIKNPLGINPDYGAFYLNSITESRVRQLQVGIALTHFNTKSLAKLAIPIPHLEEQNVMVMEIQKSYSFVENTTKIINFLEIRLNLLKQSILNSAFEGKLIPQDPNDEPAEILLQKIKQEKERIEQKQRIIKVKAPKRRRKNVR